VTTALDSDYLRQQHALCTYKDEELPAARRLDRALQILTQASPIDTSTDAETLGIAGAIFKRKWELEAKRADLERSLWCYDRGLQQKGHPSREYAGINAAFVSDQLAALELQALGGRRRRSGCGNTPTTSGGRSSPRRPATRTNGGTRRSARRSSASASSTRRASTWSAPGARPWLFGGSLRRRRSSGR
jgi:hypothetical protein